MITKEFMLRLLLGSSLQVLTISGHAQRHALLEAAELTTVPVHSVHHAVLLPGTLVICHTRLRPPEETLEIIQCGLGF